MKYLRWAVVLVTIFSILVMAGCGGATPETEETVTTGTEQTVVTEEDDTQEAQAAEETKDEETEKPSFFISDFQLLNTEVQQGKSIGITVVLANNGNTQGNFTVELKVNGQVADYKDVSLEGGKSQKVYFNYSTMQIGEYTAEIGQFSGSFTVVEAPPEATWQIPEGNGDILRAVHMGGNWGTNTDYVNDPPEEYFEYLRDLNVNWVGISQSLHVNGSMDSTVEFVYDGVPQSSWDDETLRNLIKSFKRHGFNVYLHVAFENTKAGDMGFDRWQLGDPFAATDDPDIDPANWPWRMDHPQYSEFIAEFWQTYTDCLVHIAEIAEEEGVGMMTVGTETDRLFRSRARGMWPNEFLDEMVTMIDSIRGVYSGLLSYEMLHFSLEERYLFGPANDFLYEDLGLDFLALSSYFSLADNAPNRVMTIEELEEAWEVVFSQHLMPWIARNPGKKIIFTEFGCTDVIESPWSPSHRQFENKVFTDNDGNGLDDGEEAQNNYFEAFYNVMNKYPGNITGTFLWDVMMAPEDVYAQGFGKMRTFNIRDKIAESLIRQQYAEWMN